MLPFTTMGSGSLAAMSILETEYKADMGTDEGIALVSKAIRAGIFNDLGSGGNVDVCVITADGGKILRNHEKPNPRMIKAQYKPFVNGTSAVILGSESVLSLVTVEDVDVQ